MTGCPVPRSSAPQTDAEGDRASPAECSHRAGRPNAISHILLAGVSRRVKRELSRGGIGRFGARYGCVVSGKVLCEAPLNRSLTQSGEPRRIRFRRDMNMILVPGRKVVLHIAFLDDAHGDSSRSLDCLNVARLKRSLECRRREGNNLLLSPSYAQSHSSGGR